MADHHFQDAEIEAEYTFTTNANERGGFYEIEIDSLKISGVKFEKWPYEYELKLLDKIADELLKELGHPPAYGYAV